MLEDEPCRFSDYVAGRDEYAARTRARNLWFLALSERRNPNCFVFPFRFTHA